MYLTYKFRIKDSSHRNWLSQQAAKVNFVWNYCNEASFKQLKNHSKWLSKRDLSDLTTGVSKELGLNSQTIQVICKEYAERRFHARKRKLSWRSQKRNLGWIPCTNQNIVVSGDSFKFSGSTFRFWRHREVPTSIKSASINEDSMGHWFLNLVCEVDTTHEVGNANLGVDLGLKTHVTTSDGRKFHRENLTKSYEAKLAMAQRAHKKRLVTQIHQKIKNARKDHSHKVANELLAGVGSIFVGNVSAAKLAKTKVAKSVLDAGWSQLRGFLAYKAEKLGKTFVEVNESWTTRTCSVCTSRCGPSGLSGLSVREWTCAVCGAEHDRDINAAQNILRVGHHTPIKGARLKAGDAMHCGIGKPNTD